MDSDSEYVKSFAPLVDFLGQALGVNTEVVLHDLSQLDTSVVAIANSGVSGRRIGSPATDLVLRMVRDAAWKDRDYISGYKGTAAHGVGEVRSSTYFLRREDKVVGMLCINTDESPIHNLQMAVHELAQTLIPPSVNNAVKGGDSSSIEESENLAASISEMTAAAVAAAVRRTGIPVERLSADDRLALVDGLYADGFFQLRGAVADVAQQLKVSEPSVYRYLQQVKRRRGEA